jgi:hypothetical protein
LFKTYELFISGIFYLIFSVMEQVTGTMGSKTVDKGETTVLSTFSTVLSVEYMFNKCSLNK